MFSVGSSACFGTNRATGNRPCSLPVMATRRSISRNAPLGRSGRAAEIADVAVFLSSDKAAWMAGAASDLHGGAYLRRYPDVLGRRVRGSILAILGVEVLGHGGESVR